MSQQKIAELKKQIADLEADDSREAWEKYEKEADLVIDMIMNKCFMIRSTIDTTTLFKVIGSKKTKQYGRPYYKLETQGYFNVKAAKYMYSRVLQNNGGPFGTFPLMAVSRKGSKTADISQLGFTDMKLGETVSRDDSQLVEYPPIANGENKPSQSFAERIQANRYELIPEVMYQDMRVVADLIAEETLGLWAKYQKRFNQFEPFIK